MARLTRLGTTLAWQAALASEAFLDALMVILLCGLVEHGGDMRKVSRCNQFEINACGAILYSC
jgi:hypothetical protein